MLPALEPPAVEPAAPPARAALDARFAQSQAVAARSHALIPGGAHTYAKGDDQLPDWAPLRLTHGQGCEVWDADGHRYIEYGMGLRAVTLGHAHPEVVGAACRAMWGGANFSRPAVVEVEAAEALLGMLPGAEMVKFSKDGSSVTTAAIKLARAYTGRDLVAICADHPFFSYDDWFIGTTAMDAGIPQAIRAQTVTFRYNDLASAERLFAAHPGQIAAVILEPSKGDDPHNGFLHRLQALCQQHGAVFILDEMITGFRWANGGAQGLYGITPDLSTFGKGIANGFSVSALVGKRDLMELGGLHHDGERVFLLSATHGAETHGLAAALATLAVYQRDDVIGFMDRAGRRLKAGLDQQIAAAGVAGYVDVSGRPCNLVFGTRDAQGAPSQPFRTLLLGELLLRGILAPSLVVSYSHTDDHLDRTIDAFGAALHVYRRALDDGLDGYLVGRAVAPVFRRFNDPERQRAISSR